jgi:hypothetical protein
MGLFSYLKLRQIEKNTRPEKVNKEQKEVANVAAITSRDWTREELIKHPELLDTSAGAWARELTAPWAIELRSR